MNFWDSSALVPLLVEEKSTASILNLWEERGEILGWTMTPVEVVSAVCRLCREGLLHERQVETALASWDEIREGIHYIRDVETVKQRAVRLLRVHALRAADALQLAAALVACSDSPRRQGFVTLDGRLADAAHKEGFEVRPFSARPDSSVKG